MNPDATAGWLFVQADRLPERWRQRARPAMYVPLLSAEIEELFSGHLSGPALSQPEQDLAKLLAQGRSASAIARRLGVSHRTVERRLAALRDRLGTGSTAELALALARNGFSMAEGPTPGVAGSPVAGTNPLANDAAKGRD